MTTETNNPPKHRIKIGSVEATIWENQSTKGPFPSVAFSRTYKSQGTLKSSYSFNAHHLADLKRVVSEAEIYMKANWK